MNRLTPMKVMLNFRDKLRFAFQVSARRMPRHYFLTLLTYHNLGGSARTKGGSGLFQSSFGPGPNLYSGSGHELRRHNQHRAPSRSSGRASLMAVADTFMRSSGCEAA